MSFTKSFGVLSVAALLFTSNVASAQVIDPTTATSAATTFNAVNNDVRTVQVVIRDNVFDPHNVVVPSGSTVTWRNQGSLTHTVQADRGAFYSGAIPPGGTYSRIMDVPGTYLYYDPAYGAAGGEGMFGIIVVMPPTTGTGGGTVGGGAVLGETTGTPFLPNTGDGGMEVINVILLALSGLIMVGGALVLRERLAGRRDPNPYFFA